MTKEKHHPVDEAEIIALKALGFLAAEPERLGRFLGMSGLDLDTIRANANTPAFLSGVLDHLLGDQTLLLLFAETEGLNPTHVERARQQLPGVSHDF